MDRLLAHSIISKKYNYDMGMSFSFCYCYNITNYKSKRYKEKIENFLRIFSSPFNNDKRVEKYIEFIGVYNRYIKLFSIIQNKWRARNYNKYDYDYDLIMNPLCNFKESEKMTIIQNKTLYTFTIQDLLKIIYNSLMKSEYIQEKPKIPKNPYNNLKFSDNILYNVYIYCKLNNINMNYFVKQYYKSNLNIRRFRCDNNFKLNNYAIKNYIYYATEEDLYDEIYTMFGYIESEDLYYEYGIEEGIQLEDPDNTSDTYKNKLVNICKKMLHPYFVHVYKTRHEPSIDKYYISKMMNYLKIFIKQHGKFWRKKIKVLNRNRNSLVGSFSLDSFRFDFNPLQNEIIASDSSGNIQHRFFLSSPPVFNFDASVNEINESQISEPSSPCCSVTITSDNNDLPSSPLIDSDFDSDSNSNSDSDSSSNSIYSPDSDLEL